MRFRDNGAQLRAVPAVGGGRGVGPDPAVAVPPGAALAAGAPPRHHPLGTRRGARGRVPAGGAGRGGAHVGRQEEQGQHELRQAQPRTQVRNHDFWDCCYYCFS